MWIWVATPLKPNNIGVPAFPATSARISGNRCAQRHVSQRRQSAALSPELIHRCDSIIRSCSWSVQGPTVKRPVAWRAQAMVAGRSGRGRYRGSAPHVPDAANVARADRRGVPRKYHAFRATRRRPIRALSGLARPRDRVWKRLRLRGAIRATRKLPNEIAALSSRRACDPHASAA